MASFVGVTKATINSYEKGRTEPNISALIKLSELFNVSIDYVLDVNGNTWDITTNKTEKLQLIHALNSLSEENVKKVLSYAEALNKAQQKNG